MSHDRILKKIFSIPWAIEKSWLKKIVAIAEREVDIVALEAKLGKPLEYTYSAQVRGNTAIIPIEGPIFHKANLMTELSGATSLEMVARDFQSAVDNDAIDNIVLKMNSPGGSVVGIDEMYSLIKAANKKVVAHVSGSGNSAAYWIATAADEILITPASQVGSIGVVQVSMIDGKSKDSELEFVSSASPRKRLDPKTDEGREAIMHGINSIAEVFISNVAESRGTSPEVVKQNYGKGGVLIGQEAVDVGMVDGIATFEELMASLSEQNYSSYGENSMNVKELKAEHPKVYETVLAEGKTAAEDETSKKVDDLQKANEALTAENAKLKEELEASKDEAEATNSRLKALEKKDAIRDAQAIKAKADSIVAAKLSASVIPENLHVKVAAAIDHNAFVEEGTLKEKDFSAAVDTEIEDWASAFDNAPSPLAGNIGESGGEGSVAGASEGVDGAVDSLLSHIN